MTPNEIKRTSKFLSLVLRHRPGIIGLKLDKNGWADTNELLTKVSKKKMPLTLETLKIIVKENNKKRFAFNEDYSKIRASQGHSIKIDLALAPSTPPATLYHGTVAKNIPSIKRLGLLSQKRNHVHLSKDIDTATNVGQRHGKPIILIVQSGQMHRDGIPFYLSENKVWLTEQVAPKYIDFPEN